eukprot:m.28127 g.28127  ORF g.28127 m.28127 type:complete len:292 (-) comp9063_c0_seq1:21-896(-)
MDHTKTPIKRTRAEHNPSPARKTPLRHMVCMQSPATKALLALPASASPQTPMTRAKARALQAGGMFSTYLSPDLDSIALPSCEPSLDFHNDSFRSPSTLGPDAMLFRDRLFSPMTRSAARATSTPFGMPQSPLFDMLGSPSMGLLLGNSPFGRSPRRETLARPLLQDSMMSSCNFAPDSLDVFLGDSDSKRARKDMDDKKENGKEKKMPTAAAPKRGEYRCGKCGFFPKKQKHNCAPDKQKKGAAAMAPKQVSAHAFMGASDPTITVSTVTPTLILTAAAPQLTHAPMGYY